MQNFGSIFVGASGHVRVFIWVFVVVVIIVWLAYFFLFMKYFRLWLQAKLSRADVTFAELVGMTLRKVDVRQIVICRIMSVQGGIGITMRDLESHYLAGGNVANVVRALIAAKRGNIELSWKDATAIDLAGRDLLGEVQAAIETKVGTDASGNDEQELYFGDVGEAISDLNPNGQAKFGNMVVDVVADSSFIIKKSKVEIVESDSDEIVVRAVGL